MVKIFSPNMWQMMMTFPNPLDALIPKIPFSFFADFWVWVTSKARGSVSVGYFFWRSRQLSPFLGGLGSSQGPLSIPPPQIESPPTPVSDSCVQQCLERTAFVFKTSVFFGRAESVVGGSWWLTAFAWQLATRRRVPESEW